jgi:transposase-like protein
MSKPVERVEIITGIHRRRRYTAEEKVRLVEHTMQPGMTVSAGRGSTHRNRNAVAKNRAISLTLDNVRRQMIQGHLEEKPTRNLSPQPR